MTARIEKGTFVQAWATGTLDKGMIILGPGNPLHISRMEAILGERYTYFASTDTGWKKIIQQTIRGPEHIFIEPLKVGKGFYFIVQNEIVNPSEKERQLFKTGSRLKIISEMVDSKGKNHQKSRIITAI